MRLVFTGIGAVALVVLTITLAVMLLPACGVLARIAPTWVDWCPAAVRSSTEDRLAAVDTANLDLIRRIAELERELALKQCEPRRVAVAPPPTAREPDLPSIDQDRWNRREVGLLDGCWELDSNYTTVNQTTGVRTSYNTWRMCFDGNGRGTEEMLGTNNARCAGAVSARFGTDGALQITEPGNLQCNNRTFIYQRQLRCTLDANGRATCASEQPATGTTTTVEFRRAEGGN